MADRAAYSTHQHFFLKTPLYERLNMTAPLVRMVLWKPIRFDGYCPHCNQSSTFDRSSLGTDMSAYADAHFEQMSHLGHVSFKCARNDDHAMTFYYLIQACSIEKVGQYPSFADIAIDESKDYSKLLGKEDSAELHKAIGLAAHGVGIGSYVYLRRIFERLIWKRFHEYKDFEGWDETEFRSLRMKERIQQLHDHLPEFLVSNAKLYSILSLGVHELNEADCLAFFSVLRQSTICILEQDKKKKEELAQRKQLELAIARFTKSEEPNQEMTMANLMKHLPGEGNS